MTDTIDKAKDMPKLILHNWNFDEKVVKALDKMGYYNDIIYPEEFPEDEDLKDCTALATVAFYWIFWNYGSDPNESDPGIMNFTEDEFEQDGSPTSAYWKDYINCGEDKELFLELAAWKPNETKNQWFISDDGEIMEKIDDELPSHYMQLEGHKASLQEIYNYFTKQKGGF